MPAPANGMDAGTASQLIPGVRRTHSPPLRLRNNARLQFLRDSLPTGYYGRMGEGKVWLITGAGRGFAVNLAKAALGDGHAVVTTGRDAARVAAAVGSHDNLLATTLDVTRPEDSRATVEAAVARCGRIDILVNNAESFYAGLFEELSPEQIRNQIETLLFGPMNVARAVLLVMRKQRSGLLLTISSTAGIAGQLFCTEIAPFGIRTMLVEPGFLRTELLSKGSTTYAAPYIADYAERTKEIVAAWTGMDGKQPPFRFPGGADAVQPFKAKANALLTQAHAHHELSTSLALNEAGRVSIGRARAGAPLEQGPPLTRKRS